MVKSQKEKMNFEEAFHKLETIVEKLESGESSLEVSMQLFEEGMDLIKFCSTKLNQAELRLQKLIKQENGEFTLESAE
jgi:exodeoxyribonuclease VII small subunit